MYLPIKRVYVRHCQLLLFETDHLVAVTAHEIFDKISTNFSKDLVFMSIKSCVSV